MLIQDSMSPESDIQVKPRSGSKTSNSFMDAYKVFSSDSKIPTSPPSQKKPLNSEPFISIGEKVGNFENLAGKKFVSERIFPKADSKYSKSESQTPKAETLSAKLEIQSSIKDLHTSSRENRNSIAENQLSLMVSQNSKLDTYTSRPETHSSDSKSVPPQIEPQISEIEIHNTDMALQNATDSFIESKTSLSPQSLNPESELEVPSAKITDIIPKAHEIQTHSNKPISSSEQGGFPESVVLSDKHTNVDNLNQSFESLTSNIEIALAKIPSSKSSSPKNKSSHKSSKVLSKKTSRFRRRDSKRLSHIKKSTMGKSSDSDHINERRSSSRSVSKSPSPKSLSPVPSSLNTIEKKPTREEKVYKRDDRAVKLNLNLFRSHDVSSILRTKPTNLKFSEFRNTHYEQSTPDDKSYLSGIQPTNSAPTSASLHSKPEFQIKPKVYQARPIFSNIPTDEPKLESRIKEINMKNRIYNNNNNNPPQNRPGTSYSSIKQEPRIPDTKTSFNRYQKGSLKDQPIPEDSSLINSTPTTRNYNPDSQTRVLNHIHITNQSMINIRNDYSDSFSRSTINQNGLSSEKDLSNRNSELLTSWEDKSSIKKINRIEIRKPPKKKPVKPKELKRISNLDSLFSDIALDSIEINPNLTTSIAETVSKTQETISELDNELEKIESYVSINDSLISTESNSGIRKNAENIQAPPKINEFSLDGTKKSKQTIVVDYSPNLVTHIEERSQSELGPSMLNNRAVNNILDSNTRKNILRNSSTVEASPEISNMLAKKKPSFSFRSLIGLKKKKSSLR
ncbi:hypothetical protein AYI68_g7728 [Smittium mucronatum]|uniref:Uncharacterized protein n=1 Tax=Smittium mucronatum TaxID=133383 RepID=A0A1R0GMY1_9FUNG|nr:hypothetical protein AYI68_g7728 [Smittium mucronatum]